MRYIFLLLIVALYGCKKDTYTDEYIKGHEYERTFYVTDIDNKFKIIYISSTDSRKMFSVRFGDPLGPTDLTKPNLEETDDLKLYQVADFKFIWGLESSIDKIYTKTRDWRWVYGRLKDDWSHSGVFFQRLEIVREI